MLFCWILSICFFISIKEIKSEDYPTGNATDHYNATRSQRDAIQVTNHTYPISPIIPQYNKQIDHTRQISHIIPPYHRLINYTHDGPIRFVKEGKIKEVIEHTIVREYFTDDNGKELKDKEGLCNCDTPLKNRIKRDVSEETLQNLEVKTQESVVLTPSPPIANNAEAFEGSESWNYHGQNYGPHGWPTYMESFDEGGILHYIPLFSIIGGTPAIGSGIPINNKGLV